MIRSSFDKYFDDGAGANISERDRDNFYDLPDPYLLGFFTLSLADLFMWKDCVLDTKMISALGPREVGSLKVKVSQTNESG